MFSTYHHMTHNFQGCFRKYLQLHKMSNLLQILSIPPFISPLSLSVPKRGFPRKNFGYCNDRIREFQRILEK